jgi:hypothetical protein
MMVFSQSRIVLVCRVCGGDWQSVGNEYRFWPLGARPTFTVADEASTKFDQADMYGAGLMIDFSLLQYTKKG